MNKDTLAPGGVLRAVINLGNPILAHRMPAVPGGDAVGGVSVDLARALAAELGVPLQLTVVESAGRSVEIVTADEADVGFFAVDPQRGQGLRFTAPYVLIEGACLVRDAAPQRALDEVDRPGTRVVVGRGSAYDLYLTRTLQHAEIVRSPTSPSVVEVFLDGGFDVAAGVRQQLEADRVRHADADAGLHQALNLRLLPGAFMVIRQAMGLPRHRSPQATLALHDFVERHKRSGFIADALRRHGIEGAGVAPAEPPSEHTA